MIEGIVGSSFTGDIAIDDVKVVANDCPAPGFCDFELGFCSWAQGPDGMNFIIEHKTNILHCFFLHSVHLNKDTWYAK